MKYVNAADILPDQLLKELQKYAEGEALYIPKANRAGKKKWGEGSGARAYYRERNEKIKAKYAKGIGVSQLAEEHCLAVETIRKIIYSNG